MGTTDFYEELGISPDSTREQIAAAIRDQEKLWRRRQNAPKREQQYEAGAKLEMIGKARKVLLDPQARQAYDRELANKTHDPDPEPLTPPTHADPEEWIRRADEYLAQANWKAAHYAAREACAAAPSNAKAWELRARSSAALNHQQDAEFEFQEAAQLGPQVVSVYIAWAQSRRNLKDWAGALEVLNTAARFAPGDYDVLRQTAICQVGAGDADSAVRTAEQLVKAYPNSQGAPGFLARILLEASLSKLTIGRDDSRYITSPAQAMYLDGLLPLALSLRIDEPQHRATIDQWLALARRSLRRAYSPTKSLLTWILIVALMLIYASVLLVVIPAASPSGFSGVDVPDLPGYSLVALFAVTPILWAIGSFYSRHWIPQWQLTRRALEATGVERWGIDSPAPLPIVVEASHGRP